MCVGWSGLSHHFLMLSLWFVHGIVVLCNEVLHLISTGHPLHACPIVTMYCTSEESSGYWKRLDSKCEVLAWAPEKVRRLYVRVEVSPLAGGFARM